MFKIYKQFTIDVAHRVECQVLPKGYECKCRGLHGHTAGIEVGLECPTDVNSLINGMVVDYTLFHPFKQFLDEWFDHRLVIHERDQILAKLLAGIELEKYTTVSCTFGGFQLTKWDSYIQCEWLGRITVTTFPTTSECMAYFFYKYLQDMICNIDSAYISPDTRMSYVLYKETGRVGALYQEDN